MVLIARETQDTYTSADKLLTINTQGSEGVPKQNVEMASVVAYNTYLLDQAAAERQLRFGSCDTTLSTSGRSVGASDSTYSAVFEIQRQRELQYNTIPLS
jgi:hypothetical protein